MWLARISSPLRFYNRRETNGNKYLAAPAAEIFISFTNRENSPHSVTVHSCATLKKKRSQTEEGEMKPLFGLLFLLLLLFCFKDFWETFSPHSTSAFYSVCCVVQHINNNNDESVLDLLAVSFNGQSRMTFFSLLHCLLLTLYIRMQNHELTLAHSG